METSSAQTCPTTCDTDMPRGNALQVRALVEMAEASKDADVLRCLEALGAKQPLHRYPLEALRAFERYSLVSLGPKSAALWRQDGARSDPCPQS